MVEFAASDVHLDGILEFQRELFGIGTIRDTKHTISLIVVLAVYAVRMMGAGRATRAAQGAFLTICSSFP